MSAMHKVVRVFVSSTWEDLHSERVAVEKALHRMRETVFRGMEYFGSRPDKPRDVCLREVDLSDVYVGVIGDRYGSIDPESGLSMTEIEYKHARGKGMPCLIYIKENEVSEATLQQFADNLAQFKDALLRSHVVSFFQTADQLSTLVSVDLHNLFAEGALPRYRRNTIGPVLRSVITRHLDLEEFRTLCFDLSVDFDDLRGEGKAAKVRELVLYLQRRGRLDELVNLLKQIRPSVASRLQILNSE